MTTNAISHQIMEALNVPLPHVTVGGSNRTGWRVYWHDDPATPPQVLAGPTRTAKPMRQARNELARVVAVALMECKVCERMVR